IRLRPGNSKDYSNRGMAYCQIDQFEAANEDLTEAIRLDQGNAEAYGWRGWTAYKRELHKQAIGDLDEAIRLQPDSGPFHYWRGLAAYSLAASLTDDNPDQPHEAFGQAIASLTQALALGKNDASVYAHRGSSYFGLDRYEPALGDLEEAIRLAP